MSLIALLSLLLAASSDSVQTARHTVMRARKDKTWGVALAMWADGGRIERLVTEAQIEAAGEKVETSYETDDLLDSPTLVYRNPQGEVEWMLDLWAEVEGEDISRIGAQRLIQYSLLREIEDLHIDSESNIQMLFPRRDFIDEGLYEALETWTQIHNTPEDEREVLWKKFWQQAEELKGDNKTYINDLAEASGALDELKHLDFWLGKVYGEKPGDEGFEAWKKEFGEDDYDVERVLESYEEDYEDPHITADAAMLEKIEVIWQDNEIWSKLKMEISSADTLLAFDSEETRQDGGYKVEFNRNWDEVMSISLESMSNNIPYWSAADTDRHRVSEEGTLPSLIALGMITTLAREAAESDAPILVLPDPKKNTNQILGIEDYHSIATMPLSTFLPFVRSMGFARTFREKP